MRRRDFLAVAGGVQGALGLQSGDDSVPVRKARVAKLFKSPDGHPNGLETSPEGLWIGEQVSERAYLVDRNGKVLHKVDTESHNTSGIGVGAGFLWMAANGQAVIRDPRPTDRPHGEVIKADLKTGKTVERFGFVWGGGVHGLEFAEGNLWVTALSIRALAQVSPQDFRILRQIPLRLGRAHGLAWDNGAIWCVHSSDYVIHKLDAKTGRLLEAIQLSKEHDPDPHGLCIRNGELYYCDAGIAPGSKPTGSPHAGYVCKIERA